MLDDLLCPFFSVLVKYHLILRYTNAERFRGCRLQNISPRNIFRDFPLRKVPLAHHTTPHLGATALLRKWAQCKVNANKHLEEHYKAVFLHNTPTPTACEVFIIQAISSRLSLPQKWLVQLPWSNSFVVQTKAQLVPKNLETACLVHKEHI